MSKLIEIKNSFNESVIVSGKYNNIKEALEKNLGADLSGADLSGAYLSGAVFDKKYLISMTSIVPEGDIIGYKKCQKGIIVKLLIPAYAKRSNATGRKCRASYVEVLHIYGGHKKAISVHDKKTEYVKGAIVKADYWEQNRFIECAGGIHFFLTKEEAERY